MSKFRRTMSGEDPLVVVSLLRKAIRRNRPGLAGWAANELIRSAIERLAERKGHGYLRHLLTIIIERVS